MREFGLTDNDARLFIYRAFVEYSVRGMPRNLISAVHDLYFNPAQVAFRPRNLWSLSNAFTSAFKKLQPVKQLEVTARLGKFLNDFRESLTRRPEEEPYYSSERDPIPFPGPKSELDSEFDDGPIPNFGNGQWEHMADDLMEEHKEQARAA